MEQIIVKPFTWILIAVLIPVARSIIARTISGNLADYEEREQRNILRLRTAVVRFCEMRCHDRNVTWFDKLEELRTILTEIADEYRERGFYNVARIFSDPITTGWLEEAGSEIKRAFNQTERRLADREIEAGQFIDCFDDLPRLKLCREVVIWRRALEQRIRSAKPDLAAIENTPTLARRGPGKY